MNIAVTYTFEMLERIESFMLKHVIPLPRATAARAEVLATINALRTAAKSQTGGRNQSAGGAQLRESCWRALRQVLREINRTARTLEAEHPGIRATFRLPRTRSFPAQTTSAKAIIAAATPIKDSFVAAGLPETFLTEVTTVLAAFEAATAQKHGGKIAQVAATAALKAEAARGIQAATKLDACVRNHFRHQPEILAAWTHARHIQRGRSRPRPTSPPPAPAPAPAPTAQPPPIPSLAAIQPPAALVEKAAPLEAARQHPPGESESTFELSQHASKEIDSASEMAPQHGAPAEDPSEQVASATPAPAPVPFDLTCETLCAPVAPEESVPPRRTSHTAPPEQISLFPDF